MSHDPATEMRRYMKNNRRERKKVARRGGWFWLPCPLCGTEFGGQEWKNYDGLPSGIPTPGSAARDQNGVIYGWSSKGICPACTLEGKGKAGPP